MSIFMNGIYDVSTPTLGGILNQPPTGFYTLSATGTTYLSSGSGLGINSTSSVYFALSSPTGTINNQAVIGIGYNLTDITSVSALSANYIVLLSSCNGAVGNAGDTVLTGLTIGIAPTSATVTAAMTVEAILANRSSIIFNIPAAAPGAITTLQLQVSALSFNNSDPHQRRIYQYLG